MKLITLAKKLDFNSEAEYFDYMINSWFNGNFAQCKELFFDMTKVNRKDFLKYIEGCYDHSHEVYYFYWNLI